MMTPAAKVISKCGGVHAVAEMIDVDISNVYRWTYPKERGGTGGVIPARHQSRIMSEARKRALDVRPEDFFQVFPDSQCEVGR